MIATNPTRASSYYHDNSDQGTESSFSIYREIFLSKARAKATACAILSDELTTHLYGRQPSLSRIQLLVSRVRSKRYDIWVVVYEWRSMAGSWLIPGKRIIQPERFAGFVGQIGAGWQILKSGGKAS